MGFWDAIDFLKVLQEAPRGIEVPLVKLMRSLTIEYWLSSLQHHAVLDSTERSSKYKSVGPSAGHSTEGFSVS
jgi:hypothetical protein